MNRVGKILLPLFLCFLPVPGFGQTHTVGVIDIQPGVAEGYVLLAPVGSTHVYLLDNCGRLVNEWSNSTRFPGSSVYLMDDGSLLKTCRVANPTFNMGGRGGKLERWSWNDSLMWEFTYSSNMYVQHHDIEILPNGNVLLLATERKLGLDLIAAGRNPAFVFGNEVWSEMVVEVSPTGPTTGAIVWEWHAWDHLVQDYDSMANFFGVVSDHQELIDLNFVPGNLVEDWLHANAVDYNPFLDQVMISLAKWGEFWVVDHSTSTLEASGHSGGLRNKGGDLLYRWGNPMAYGRGDSTDTHLEFQHDAHWIPAGRPDSGKVILYNNGMDRLYSSAEILNLPQSSPGDYILLPGQNYGPDTLDWEYAGDSTSRFFSRNMSGAQQQINGNVLICTANLGEVIEVDLQDSIVWHYRNPITQAGPLTQGDPVNPSVNVIFRLERYEPNFSGFAGKNMTPGDPLELNFDINDCLGLITNQDSKDDTGFQAEKENEFEIFPVPANNWLTIRAESPGLHKIEILDLQGRAVLKDMFSENTRISLESIPEGIYILRLNDKIFRKIVKVSP